jgi:hypothetical protein
VVSRSELKECLGQEDLTLGDQDIDELIKEVDTNGDGQIDYLEFLIMMQDKQ